MKTVMKHFCQKLRPIPSPKIQSTALSSKLLGHFKDLKDYMKVNKQNIGMVLLVKSGDWYKETNSRIIQIDILRTKLLMVSDPKLFKEILGSKQDSFTNSIGFKITFGYFFPNSMIVVDGDQWQKIRKIAQRAITKTSLEPVVKIGCDIIEETFAKTIINEIDTYDLLCRLTFDSFHKVMYGWDPRSVHFDKDSSELVKSCLVISEALGKRGFLPFKILWIIPTKENRHVDKANLYIKKFIVDFIEKQKRELKENLNRPGYVKTLLDEMILASESGEEGILTKDELIDNIATLFFGAFDTTSNTLMFFLNYLAKYPDIQEKLRNAVKEKYSTMEELKNAKLSDIENMRYLNNFVDEVHRLSALAPFFGRDCIKDVIIGDFQFKKGYRVTIDSRTVGRDPQFWNGITDLEEFRPDRWDEFRPSTLENVLPFGFGGRICPGRKIALAEMKVFLCAIIVNHKIEFRNKDDTEWDVVVGLNIKPGTGNIKFTKI